MLIGLECIGACTFRNTYPFNVTFNEVNLKKLILDEMRISRDISDYLNNQKEQWKVETIALAQFNGDLEAGNFNANNFDVTGWRIKRKKIGDVSYKIIVDLDIEFNEVMTYEDYTVEAGVEYEYALTPLMGEVEGDYITKTIEVSFGGWWIIDKDNPENNIQFNYNLKDTTVSIEEDRTEISTFAKYPMVRYGQKRARKGRLSGLFIPENSTVKEQVEKLDNLLKEHKSLLLKNDRGNKYIVDISAPRETMRVKPIGLSEITVEWVEVGEPDD